MIYILIYWLVGVVANMVMNFCIERTERYNWKTFLLMWVVLPFVFPLTLFALKDDIMRGFKKKIDRSEKKNTKSINSSHEITEPIDMKKTVDDDPFKKEWQEFIKDTMPNEDVKIIERKIVVNNYKVSKDYKKMVMYLEDSRNEMVNAFIGKNHHVISKIFKQWDYDFMYAPKEMEIIANHYDASMPSVEWNASKLLEMQGCQLDEPIGIAMAIIEDIEWGDEQDCWVATLKGVQLDAENEHDLTEQIRGYWRKLNKKYQAEKEERSCLRYRMGDDEKPQRHIVSEMETMYYGGPDDEDTCMVGGNLFTDDGESVQSQRDEELRLKWERKIREAEERKCKMSAEREEQTKGFFSGIVKKLKSDSDDLEKFPQDFVYDEVEECKCVRDQELVYPAKPDTFFEELETLSEEDEQLLREIQELIERLHHSGIRQQLIEQMVRMTVKPSVLQVTDDARLLLTKYNKEVKMLPIDKLVYIFFLRHPEGVALKDLADHKEELINIYTRIQGRQLTQNQLASIGRLCNPLDNSINEKLSRIKQAFRAVAHDSVANCYIVQGERGELRNITLNEELIELGVWGR